MNTDGAHPDLPTAGESYRTMQPHVPAMRDHITACAHDDRDAALLTARRTADGDAWAGRGGMSGDDVQVTDAAPMCWCGMTDKEHVSWQSRCPKTPAQVREWSTTLTRINPPTSGGVA